MHGVTRGVPPVLDLEREKALQQLLVDGAMSGVIQSAHDCAEGGIAVTAAESSFDTGLGSSIDLTAVAASAGYDDIATLFGESASRVLVSVRPNDAAELVTRARKLGVPAVQVGSVGGDRIRLSIAGRTVIDEPLRDAEHLWSNAIGSHFEKQRAIA